MICPNCHEIIDEDSVFCKHCGYEIQYVPEFDAFEYDNMHSMIGTVQSAMSTPEAHSFDVNAQTMEFSAVSGKTMDLQAVTQNTIVMNAVSPHTVEMSAVSPHTLEMSAVHPHTVEMSAISGHTEEITDLGNHTEEFEPPKALKRRRFIGSPLFITMTIVIVVLMLALAVSVIRNRSVHRDYNYYYVHSLSSADDGDYKKAIRYAEKALSLHPEEDSLRLSLARYYIASGRAEDGIYLYRELLTIPALSYDCYDALIQYYVGEEDYFSLKNLLSDCDNTLVLRNFSRYVVKEIESSVYFDDESNDYVISLVSDGNGQIFFYKEMQEEDATGETDFEDDEKTIRLSDMKEYTEPIHMDSGVNTVYCKYVTAAGMEGDLQTFRYELADVSYLTPTFNLSDGAYYSPKMVKASYPKGCILYYDVNAETFDVEKAKVYSGAFPLLFGNNTYTFVVYDPTADLYSAKVHLEMSLKITYTYGKSDCISVLKNKLVSLGKLYDTEGTSVDQTGVYSYEAKSAYEFEGSTLYLIEESYTSEGTTVSHGYKYAVDVDTAQCYMIFMDSSDAINVYRF